MAGKVDIVWITPERSANAKFMDQVLSRIAATIGLVVIDEVHCISDWGHDFRPDYRRIVEVLRRMPPNMPVVGTPATANDRVVADIQNTMGNVYTQRGPLQRESLALQALVLPNQAHRLVWLSNTIPRLPGTGTVYTLTIRDADNITR